MELPATPDQFIADSNKYLELLKKDDYWQKVPMLNNANHFTALKEAQLVRFRGIVQDMHDPEIYLETFELKLADNTTQTKCAKYRDNLNLAAGEQVILESNLNVHKERRPLFMVSVPGLNDWAIDIQRQLCGAIITNDGPPKNISNGIKRGLDTSASMDDNQASSQGLTKKSISLPHSNSQTEQKGLSREYLLNSPIAERPSQACLAKFYENFSDLTLNSVLDVVGFLSVDPSLCGTFEDPDECDNFEEVCAKNPPPSLIPRIHVIATRAVNNLNPMLDNGDLSMTPEQMCDIYKDLKLVFTQCLFGDEMAANYLLCHLISTVYVRGDQSLGQFSINITNFPSEVLPDYTKQFYEIIESLLPASHYLPITLDNLNTLEFIPAKDYNTGKLTSGLLQLAPHTHLVLDETCLQPGKLENHGIQSVVNISNLIRTQKLKVNFKFYEIEYDANVPILVLSEGKSMFPSNCHIPLQPDPDCVHLFKETIAAGRHFLKPKLEMMRVYLSLMRLRDFDMTPTSMELIQEDFVAMRRDFNATADDLHSMLVLSRMLGIIRGRISLDEETWLEAKGLEDERRKRVSVIPSK